MTDSTEITASEQLDSIGNLNKIIIEHTFLSIMICVYVIGKSIDKKCEGSSTKIFGTTVKTTPVMNNNLAVTPTLSSSTEEPTNISLLKKVS